MAHIVDFIYKNKKFGKRKMNLFNWEKKSDPELIKIHEDYKIFRLKKTKTKTRINNICKDLEKDVKELDRRYSKRVKELGFKLVSIPSTKYQVEYRTW